MATRSTKRNTTVKDTVEVSPAELEVQELDPPDPALTRWQVLVDRERSVDHKWDVSEIVPLPRPTWSDIERDEIRSSVHNCRYVSTPVRVASKYHELGVAAQGEFTSAAAYVVAVMTGTGSTRVRVSWSRQSPKKADGWVNEEPFNFTPAEALELADVLRAAVDLFGGTK